LRNNLRIFCGANIPRNNRVLDCTEPPRPQEAEDSFSAYSGTITQSRKEVKAYHINGTDERGGFVHIITGSMDADVVLQKAREKGVTVTEYLTAVLILSVDAIQRRRVRTCTGSSRSRSACRSNSETCSRRRRCAILRTMSTRHRPAARHVHVDETLNIVHHLWRWRSEKAAQREDHDQRAHRAKRDPAPDAAVHQKRGQKYVY
jgi:hypothetical protein